jgi:hypothetical protein
MLRVGGSALIACVERSIRQAPLGNADAVDAVVRRVAARCRAGRCGSSLRVTLSSDATAHDLLEVMAATRRAGFDRVLFDNDPGCAPLTHDQRDTE